MMLKRVLLCLTLVCMMFASACGKKVEVKIVDGEVETTLEVTVPKKVEKILKEAEIELGEEDVVTPGLEDKLEDAGEIKVQRMHHVSISVDGKVTEAKMLDGTVADILKQEGITLASNMTMNVKNEDLLTEGMEIIIETAYGVTFTHDGKTETAAAKKGTVADFLKAADVTLGADDTVEPALDTEITEGMEITVYRVTYEETTVTETIPYDTVRQNDNTMNKGTEVVAVKGVNGEKNVTYKIKKVDGKEVEKTVLKEEIIKKPVSAVVKVGTKQGRYIVSKTAYPNCDDPRHGYYEIKYSDGTVEYQEY